VVRHIRLTIILSIGKVLLDRICVERTISQRRNAFQSDVKHISDLLLHQSSSRVFAFACR
jgi:hypothetical protein